MMETYKEIRELTADERKQKMSELRQEYFNLRCQHKTGQLENTSRLSAIRKDIAKVMTSMNEKNVSAPGGESS